MAREVEAQNPASGRLFNRQEFKDLNEKLKDIEAARALKQEREKEEDQTMGGKKQKYDSINQARTEEEQRCIAGFKTLLLNISKDKKLGQVLEMISDAGGGKRFEAYRDCASHAPKEMKTEYDYRGNYHEGRFISLRPPVSIKSKETIIFLLPTTDIRQPVSIEIYNTGVGSAALSNTQRIYPTEDKVKRLMQAFGTPAKAIEAIRKGVSEAVETTTKQAGVQQK